MNALGWLEQIATMFSNSTPQADQIANRLAFRPLFLSRWDSSVGYRTLPAWSGARLAAVYGVFPEGEILPVGP